MYYISGDAGHDPFYDSHKWHPTTLHALWCGCARGYTKCFFFWTLCIVREGSAGKLVQDRWFSGNWSHSCYHVLFPYWMLDKVLGILCHDIHSLKGCINLVLLVFSFGWLPLMTLINRCNQCPQARWCQKGHIFCSTWGNVAICEQFPRIHLFVLICVDWPSRPSLNDRGLLSFWPANGNS